ncbi:MAG: hypothetical protein AAGD38_21220 [Acidobacteriota bacterium]
MNSFLAILYKFLSYQPKKVELQNQKPKTFSELLHESQMVQAGDLSQAYTFGTITNRIEDDLYIDFGGKFECVCKAPKPKDTIAKGSKEPEE